MRLVFIRIYIVTIYMSFDLIKCDIPKCIWAQNALMLRSDAAATGELCMCGEVCVRVCVCASECGYVCVFTICGWESVNQTKRPTDCSVGFRECHTKPITFSVPLLAARVCVCVHSGYVCLFVCVCSVCNTLYGTRTTTTAAPPPTTPTLPKHGKVSSKYV